MLKQYVACRYLDREMFEYFYLKNSLLIFDNYVLTPVMSPFQLMLFLNNEEEIHQIVIHSDAYDSMRQLDMNTLKRIERVLQDLSKGRFTDIKSIKALTNVSEIRLLGSSGTSNARIYFIRRDNIISILEVTYKSDMKISESLLKSIDNRLKEKSNNFIELRLD